MIILERKEKSYWKKLFCLSIRHALFSSYKTIHGLFDLLVSDIHYNNTINFKIYFTFEMVVIILYMRHSLVSDHNHDMI